MKEIKATNSHMQGRMEISTQRKETCWCSEEGRGKHLTGGFGILGEGGNTAQTPGEASSGSFSQLLKDKLILTRGLSGTHTTIILQWRKLQLAQEHNNNLYKLGLDPNVSGPHPAS